MKAGATFPLPRKIILTSALLYKPDAVLKRAGLAGGWVSVISIPPEAAEQLIDSKADRAMQVLHHGRPGGPLTVCVVLQAGGTQLRSVACGKEADIHDWLSWLDETKRAHWLIYRRDGGRSRWLSHERESNAAGSREPAMVSIGTDGPDRTCDIEEVGSIAVELGRPASKFIGSLLPGQAVETLVVSAAGSLLQPELRNGSLIQTTT